MPAATGGARMGQYLLSTYTADDEAPRAPSTPEEMKTFMKRVAALEDEMEASGTFVFGGQLHGPDAATVVRAGEIEAVLTDGPFVEAKEHVARSEEHTSELQSL